MTILVCPVTIFIAMSSPMTKADANAVKMATSTCAKTYPEAPCLISLEKRENLVYRAICGEKIKVTYGR